MMLMIIRRLDVRGMIVIMITTTTMMTMFMRMAMMITKIMNIMRRQAMTMTKRIMVITTILQWSKFNFASNILLMKLSGVYVG